ncbi:molybdate ABC transporter substrate-binding protein [Adhaeribacter aquaticus]|uniref:molybdate ABC transporter substrate-binding protein n=1 Tax=Adhaeribacter aquaticus TaxID=299567 RepID=UPI000550E8E7|nr:molybdate ABC transporter substrate-binding protein [Adhaeribacter aquaticus]
MYRYFLILALFLGINTCGQAQKVRVAVAANAQFVAELLKQAFEKETGAELELIIGSSGKLTTQIQQGAPFDILLSADTHYPAALEKAGLAASKPKIYAYGALVLWTTKNIDLTKGVPVVLSPAIKKIAVANAQTAPYGAAALQVLSYFNVNAAVKPKIVNGESVAQVNQYVLSGAVDLGFTAKSVVLEPAMKVKGNWVEISKKAYSPIAQSAVLLNGAKKRNWKNARLFYNFLYSTKAKAIFTKYGYSVK